MTTWRKKICLYKTMTKSYLNDITLSLSIITLLDSTVVTKIWASNMHKDCYIFVCAYALILKINLRNLK